jgi:hypothetical protein
MRHGTVSVGWARQRHEKLLPPLLSIAGKPDEWRDYLARASHGELGARSFGAETIGPARRRSLRRRGQPTSAQRPPHTAPLSSVHPFTYLDGENRLTGGHHLPIRVARANLKNNPTRSSFPRRRGNERAPLDVVEVWPSGTK